MPDQPMTPAPEHLAEARKAYLRYGGVTDYKNFQGNSMPQFEALPYVIQCAWCAAANTSYYPKSPYGL